MSDWLTTLKQLAPTVAVALGGPLAGLAVTAIGSILGDEKPSVESITKAITSGLMTPEQVTKLRELELQYLENEKERGFKYAELVFKTDELIGKDRSDARAMQIATQSRMPAVITILVTIGFFGVLVSLLLVPALETNQIVLVMVGQLSAVWGACVGFYVSTTFSSGSKNALLAAK